MIIENAKIEQIKKGDFITISGLEVVKVNVCGGVEVKSNNGHYWFLKSTLESNNAKITIHRKDRAEEIREEMAKLQAELDSLDKWLPPRIAGYSEWIEHTGDKCHIRGDVIVEILNASERSNKKFRSNEDCAACFWWDKKIIVQTLLPIA